MEHKKDSFFVVVFLMKRRSLSVLFSLFLVVCFGSFGDLQCPRVGIFQKDTWSNEDMEKVKVLLPDVTLRFFQSNEVAVQDPPLHVFISVGRSQEDFPHLRALQNTERAKWLHYNAMTDLRIDHVYFNFFLSHTGHVKPELMPVDDVILQDASEYFSKFPMVSIFAATFKSGEKIWRLINSVSKQSFKNWEIVLVDDSNDKGKTFHELSQIRDARIRVYLPSKSTGFIGEVKRYAAGLCRGHILVEMDHDDALEPHCLQEIVDTYIRFPKAGFVYGDYTEWFLERNASNEYQEGYARGFGAYYRQYSEVLKSWVSVAREPDINTFTLRDSVGYPNHVRTWRADFYALIGGHNVHLPVADDIELLMRTFLRTQMVRIPRLGYVQYREPKGNNFTFLRLKEIRKLQKRLEWFFHAAINRKLKALHMRTDSTRMRVFYRHHNKTEVQMMANGIDFRKGKLLILTVRRSSAAEDVAILKNAIQTHKNAEIVAVGYGSCNLACVTTFADSLNLRSGSYQFRYWALKNCDSKLAVWYATIISETKPAHGSTSVMDFGDRFQELVNLEFFHAIDAKRNFIQLKKSFLLLPNQIGIFARGGTDVFCFVALAPVLVLVLCFAFMLRVRRERTSIKNI